MTESPAEKYISRPLSILPSDWARIERMASEMRVNPSALVRILVLPQVETWERENVTNVSETK